MQLVHDDIEAGSPIRFGGYKAKAGDWVVVDGERQYVVPLERFLAEYQEIDSEGLPIFEVSDE